MKLLLIMPRFFDYPQTISEELENMGYEVEFFDDRPSANSFVKTLLRINRNLLHRYIERYFNRMMTTVRAAKYDVVMLISGQSLSFSEEMLREIRNAQPQAFFVLYQWDSQRNFPYIQRMQKYFDKCYSFDKEDVENSAALAFLPLFYSRSYEQTGNRGREHYPYDFCFVGTAHPRKYRLIKRMSHQLKTIYPRRYIYFYFPSRIVYLYRKLCNSEFRDAKYGEFHFVPLKSRDMDRVFSESRCVLDSAQDGQIGLTIRVFEALGAGKKLITTNPDIRNYDFYREENIYVYDGTFDLSSPFFTQPYTEPEKDIYNKYSLRAWLSVLLNDRIGEAQTCVRGGDNARKQGLNDRNR